VTRHLTLSLVLASLVAAVVLAASACVGSDVQSGGIEASSLPDDVRSDYAVFAQRCSKCHSLARPLESGISDDDYWSMYVARMRRQPGSGITADDAKVILRFLHYYSLEQIEKKAKRRAAAVPAATLPPPTPPTPTPTTPPAADGGGP
jgi:hypothetical protein